MNWILFQGNTKRFKEPFLNDLRNGELQQSCYETPAMLQEFFL
jgi:hypothetical protein